MANRSENIIFSSEEPRSIEEIGDFLIQAGQKLKGQGFFTLTQEGQTVEIRPGGATKLELKYEIKKDHKHQFEIEIEWKEGAAGSTGEKVSIG